MQTFSEINNAGKNAVKQETEMAVGMQMEQVAV